MKKQKYLYRDPMVAQIFLYVKTFFAKSEDFFMQRTNTEIAESIRALAKARGVTVKQTLADCNINRNFIYDLEHGNSSPSVDKIARIADYFGVSAAVLLGAAGAENAGGAAGAENAGGAPGADASVHAFLALYEKLSDADRAELRAYMRKLLESGG